MTNQYLIDYTVRNLTTGDEEDVRVLELSSDEYAGFPDEVRDDVQSIVSSVLATRRGELTGAARVEWDATTQQMILDTLLPYISYPSLYYGDYAKWERGLLEDWLSVEPVMCVNHERTPATFTLDTPGEGWEVCDACLPAELRKAARDGHEWPYTWQGQYPRYIKVTPRGEGFKS